MKSTGNEMKLGVKLILGYLTILALMALVAIIVGINVASLMKSVGWVNHTYEVLNEVSRIEKGLVDMETGMRGFMLAGRDDFLAPYIDGEKEVFDALTKAKKLTDDNPKQVERFSKVEKEAKDWKQRVAEEQIQARREVSSGERTYAEIVAMIQQANGKQYMDQMRKILKEAKDEENSLIVPRQNDQKRSAFLTYTLLISGTILALLLGITIAFIIIRSVTKQLGGEPQEVVMVAKKLAEGDFTVELELKSGDTTSALAAMKNMVQGLSLLITEVKTTSTGIFSGARQVSDSANSLSQSATELASSIEEMSSSIEEMESTIDQNADNAVEGEKVASTSANNAKEGGEAVNQTVSSMKKIAETIQVISEIANNTNMLALNAAIEAARAGEHGEGFAVVATEVRKLAERSLKAADEIKSIANSSVQISEKAGELINDVVPAIIKTSDMVQEIASASREQKQGMKQLTKASQQQEQVTQTVSSSSEEMAASAEEMNSQAQNLIELVSRFKLNEVNTFQRKQQTTSNRQKQLTYQQNNTASSNSYSLEQHPAVKQKKDEIVYDDTEDNTGDSDDFIQL